jgi:hypothetical protein
MRYWCGEIGANVATILESVKAPQRRCSQRGTLTGGRISGMHLVERLMGR